jgi:hypothetical protein
MMMLNEAEKERTSYLNDLDRDHQSHMMGDADIMDLYSIVEESDEASQRKSDEIDLFLSCNILRKAREEDESFRKRNRAAAKALRNINKDKLTNSIISVRKVNKKKLNKNYWDHNKWTHGTACRKNSLHYNGRAEDSPGQSCIDNSGIMSAYEELIDDIPEHLKENYNPSSSVMPHWDAPVDF